MTKKIKQDIEIVQPGGYSAGDAQVTLYMPEITVRNNIFPPQEELRNCTTCIKGRQMPADKLTNSDYHYWCRWDVKEHIGVDMKYLDNTCESFIRKPKEELNLDIGSL